jgi:hypothetical protein
VPIASDGMSYPGQEHCDASRLQPQRETYQKEGHANLVEEHHRPALTALLPAAGPDATDQCRCDLLRRFEKVLRIWFCFEPF